MAGVNGRSWVSAAARSAGPWLLLAGGWAVACGGSTKVERPGPTPPGAGGSKPAASGAGGSTAGEAGAPSGAAPSEVPGAAGFHGDDLCTTTADCIPGGVCQAGLCACSAVEPELCLSLEDGARRCVSTESDEEHCGQCGVACPSGAACVRGLCRTAPTQLIKTNDCGPIRLAVQDAMLYWTERDSGRVSAMPVSGGPVKQLASEQARPSQIAADASGVYWLTLGEAGVESRQVLKQALPLTGDPPVALVTAPIDQPIGAIAVRNGKLYYALGHDVHAISVNPGDTEDVIVGTSANREDVLIDDATTGLAVDDALVAWSGCCRYMVERDDLAPGGSGYLGLVEDPGQLLLPDVASDGAYIYFADGGALWRVSNYAPQNIVGVIFERDSFQLTAFAVGEAMIFAGSYAGELLARSTLPTIDPPHVLATEQTGPTSIVISGGTVYWATDNCALRSLAF